MDKQLKLFKFAFKWRFWWRNNRKVTNMIIPKKFAKISISVPGDVTTETVDYSKNS